MIRRFLIVAGPMLALTCVAPVTAAPLGTAITYQGQLRQSGVPYAGTADLIFTLYDAASGGALLAGPITLTNISVVSGLFTVQVDFGAAFGGNARWLEIQVTTPSGSASYTTLSPRQAVNAVPYALYALASGGGSSPWNVSGTDIYYSAGRVGIGTNTPGTWLEVQGSAASLKGAVTGVQTTGSVSGAGVAGESLQSGGTGVVGQAHVGGTTPPAGVWGLSTASNGIGVFGSVNDPTGPTRAVWGLANSLNGYAGYFEGRGYFSGNVGIGTTSPNHRLRITGGPTWTTNGWSGAVELENSAAIGWRANPGGQRFGIGQSSGGLYVFRTASDPGTNASPATYDLVINDAGNVGIGTIIPSYRLQLSTDSAAKPNGGSWANSSDARVKKNIQPLTGALQQLTQLRGVTFEWIHPADHANQTGPQGGFVAQEVEKVFPSWVSEVPGGEQDRTLTADGLVKSLSLPFQFDACVVEAIKELKAQGEALQAENGQLRDRIARIEADAADIQAQLTALAAEIRRLKAQENK